MVPIQGSRQRTILALLLVNAGTIVTKDQFYDELWSGKAPANLSNALQALIMRLRKLLKNSFGDQFVHDHLLTWPMGYSLDIDKNEIDAHLFESLVGKAHERVQTDQKSALSLLDQALELWKGPALQGVVSGPISLSTAAQLEETRLAALEDRIHLAMSTGSHAGLISELKKMTQLYPYRERVVELLMLSLYRTGRQVEAVEVYNQVRTRLVEELGMEPSPVLQKRLRSILRQDSTMWVGQKC